MSLRYIRIIHGVKLIETNLSCACDVPAHNYVFSWEPKPDWSAVYAGSAEIKNYFKEFATKYGLNKYIRVNSEVSRAQWKEEQGQWEVTINETVTGNMIIEYCHILINGSGILNNWRWPDLHGLNEFEGKLLHSANYDESADLTGKRVGLIGNGYVFNVSNIFVLYR